MHAGDADIGGEVSLCEVVAALVVIESDCACLLMQVNVGAGTITCNYGEAHCKRSSASAATPVAAPLLQLQC